MKTLGILALGAFVTLVLLASFVSADASVNLVFGWITFADSPSSRDSGYRCNAWLSSTAAAGGHRRRESPRVAVSVR